MSTLLKRYIAKKSTTNAKELAEKGLPSLVTPKTIIISMKQGAPRTKTNLQNLKRNVKFELKRFLFLS